ncbi:MAG: 2OG-Fe(II) oxygenase [Pseudohongiella sp.]|nr:2OG-Fe(II) oxygenase [Pseudohongiella sp.]MDO9521364.1 2OG-Fe(II) oxygenase [Pseudohongiella sp.]MDP2125868.1 2OG-Fe(II) oxygenase [Pseudohongiella sp.]
MSLAEQSVGFEEFCFARITETLSEQSWVVVPDALPPALAEALFAQVRMMTPDDFAAAGVGRSHDHTLNSFVRRDQICWIEGANDAEKEWLAFCSRLQTYINRRLFMGLFSFESHFAHYAPGAFYKKHLDAFRPSPTERGARRVLSLVAYLNPGWQSADGGELVIYDEHGAEPVQRIQPLYGTLAIFLSDQVPHEVAAANRDRYSIAGWFRVNGTKADRVDPPL